MEVVNVIIISNGLTCKTCEIGEDGKILNLVSVNLRDITTSSLSSKHSSIWIHLDFAFVRPYILICLYPNVLGVTLLSNVIQSSIFGTFSPIKVFMPSSTLTIKWNSSYPFYIKKGCKMVQYEKIFYAFAFKIKMVTWIHNKFQFLI